MTTPISENVGTGCSKTMQEFGKQDGGGAVREVNQFLMTSRIIVFALVVGVTVFLGYALAVMEEPSTEFSVISLVMVGMAAANLVVKAVVPGLMFRMARGKIAAGRWQPPNQSQGPIPETDQGKLMVAWQSSTIVGCALLEGAAFGNTYAVLSEGQLLNAALAVGLIVMTAAHFPLRVWFDPWMQQQMDWIEAERKSLISEGSL